MNKSKFLKKSLAMVLAIMMVVAMIPLSASAAAVLPDVKYIYINNAPVEVEGNTFTADISDQAKSVLLKTNEDLGALTSPSVLAVKDQKSNDLEKVIANTNTEVFFDPYGVEDESTVTLDLVLYTKENKSNKKEFKVVLNKTSKNTTTNLADAKLVDDMSGVYDVVSFNNDTRTVNAVVARRDDGDYSKYAVKVKPADKATIDGAFEGPDEYGYYTIKGQDAKFDVVSESGNNTTEYILKTARYEDALTSFSIAGCEGIITDESSTKDGIPDTVTVTIPKTAVQNEYGEVVANPELNVQFTTYGNNAKVTFGGTNLPTGDVANDSDKVFAALTKIVDGKYDYNDITNNATIKVECQGASQTYNLKVVFEKDLDTEITYAQLNDQIATIDGDKITAELPANTNLKAVKVKFTTAATVKDVEVNGATINGDDKGNWNGTLDLTTSKIVTVTAESGKTQQYVVSATLADNVTNASLSAFILKDGDKSYIGDVDQANNTITITVPYMTTSIADWKVFATPVAGANAYGKNGKTVVNGTSTITDLGYTKDLKNISGTNKLTATYDIGTVTAKNITDTTVEKVYDVKVVLENAKSGNELESATVTAQEYTTGGDKYVYRHITEANTVKAEKGKDVSGNDIVTLKVPYSMYGGSYKYIVTDFTNETGAVLYKGSATHFSAYNFLSALGATTDDEDDKNVTGTMLADGDYVLAVPEELARQIVATKMDTLSADNIEKYDVTVYKVIVEQLPASNKAELSSFKVGDTVLNVNANGTITGTLPWSLTFDEKTDSVQTMKDTGKFAEFEISDYAQADVVYTGDKKFRQVNSLGGDNPATLSDSNIKLVFLRGADHKVTVKFLTAGPQTYTFVDNQLIIRAEDRLTGGQVTDKKFTFELEWADPSHEAKIESFSVAGMNGVVTNGAEKNTIEVVVPFGTNLKGLVPTFTTSPEATVRIASASGTILESGKTAINFTEPVNLYVTSEDTKVTVKYTVTVKTSEQFNDVTPDDWFYEDVMTAAGLGWITGTGNGNFSPANGMKRGDFALMITRVLGVDLTKYEGLTVFPDVDPEDDYYAAAVAYCAEKGYITGYEDGMFHGEKTIDRNAMAKIICCVKGLEKVTTPAKPFADDAKIAGWAKGYVYACAEAGIILGDTNNNFNGTKTAKRCEAAAVLVRAFA